MLSDTIGSFHMYLFTFVMAILVVAALCFSTLSTPMLTYDESEVYSCPMEVLFNATSHDYNERNASPRCRAEETQSWVTSPSEGFRLIARQLRVFLKALNCKRCLHRGRSQPHNAQLHPFLDGPGYPEEWLAQDIRQVDGFYTTRFQAWEVAHRQEPAEKSLLGTDPWQQ